MKNIVRFVLRARFIGRGNLRTGLISINETNSSREARSFLRAESGFTLMEVTIAVVILASALITLLGLESSIVKRTLRDDEKQQAMLIARSILSAMETNLDELEVQDKTDRADHLLESLNAAPPNESKETKETLFNFTAHLVVDRWGIPKVGDDLMKRIRLSIYMEDNKDDPFEVLFFVPNQEQDEDG